MTLSRTRIHSYVPCVVAIFEHCCRRSPLGYILAWRILRAFCTALWCSISASLAMRCTLSRAELRTARLCSNGVALSNRWYRHILFGCSNVLSFLLNAFLTLKTSFVVIQPNSAGV
jgi:hypothetical protein